MAIEIIAGRLAAGCSQKTCVLLFQTGREFGAHIRADLVQMVFLQRHEPDAARKGERGRFAGFGASEIAGRKDARRLTKLGFETRDGGRVGFGQHGTVSGVGMSHEGEAIGRSGDKFAGFSLCACGKAGLKPLADLGLMLEQKENI
ncbi:hypothetical protein [Aureimonas sp. N4]|uniref:hypothetical protein n=1 Tax=Aureimonas sp. N4 TaxID=1638165 RepID=UPI0012E3D535|nr:hypothetical protein [Aureimonas sp. N4]